MMLWRWLAGLWWARCRAIDKRMLWPACLAICGDRDKARIAFALHACHDRAWLFLGPDEMEKQIRELE